ncbi:GNAT family N-acetyltransferase [soil metagenome]
MCASSADDPPVRPVSGDPVRVRPLAPGDEAAWRGLWRGYLAFYRTELPEAVYAESFRRLNDAAVTDYHGMVAEKGGRPVGLVHYIYHRHGWQIADACYLQDLYVVEAARGAGAGRALIEAVYEAADAAGCPSVYWLTQAENAPARLLYDRLAKVTTFIKYSR